MHPGPTNPWSESNSPSLRQTQGDSHLSEYLGEQAFHRTGLGTGHDHAGLATKIVQLEQQVLDLKHLLEERDEEIAAARKAHRQHMADINRRRE